MKLLVVGAGEMGRWLADTVDANLAVVDNDAHGTDDATGVDIAFTDADPTIAADAAAGRWPNGRSSTSPA